MTERFAGSCTTACDNPSLSAELRSVCDRGSQAFCKTGSNIYGAQCRAYLRRAVAHQGALNAGTAPTNPLRLPTIAGKSETDSIRDYVRELLTTIGSTLTATSVGTADMAALVTEVRAAYPNANLNEVQRIVDAAIFTCFGSTSTGGCADDTTTVQNQTWLGEELRARVTRTVATMTNKIQADSTMLGLLNATVLNTTYRWFAGYPIITKPVVDKFISFIEVGDLDSTNKILPRCRNLSGAFRLAIDTKVISFISSSSSADVYAKAVTNMDVFTSTRFSTYLNDIRAANTAAGITTDAFLTYVDNQRTALTTTCLSNPLSQSCKTLNNVINTSDRQRVMSATVDFCSNEANISSAECVADINGSIAKTKAGTPNSTQYNIDEVNQKMLDYCASTAGRSDARCKPRPPITGSDQWLIDATKNTTDTNGVTTSKCGTIGGLSVDQCQKACSVYPDLCEADLNAKCSNPAQRYNTSVEYFGDADDQQLTDMITIIVLFVMMILVGIKIGSWWNKSMNERQLSRRNARIVPEGAFAPRTNQL